MCCQIKLCDYVGLLAQELQDNRTLHSNYGVILYQFRDIARYTLAENHDLLHSTCIQRRRPLGWSPSTHCNKEWHEKTRIMWPSDGKKGLRICLLVSTQYTHVTDRQTDRQTDGQTSHDGIGRAYARNVAKTIDVASADEAQ